ncbi:hypothetical protein JMJ58_16805 [Haloterrigena salifodinae]|uniref:Uncharacterized protein n=1 Tax=Haloterrigena salifodinae TaxID=2675099 RepID=A0A8T8DYC4_9EURY|nr:hypothetical protein [Haloterrigena salifodinae]QRV14578.1 hypothetical protein JMJ58_16805 [Haloterrigena salifodinae]
MTKPKLPKARYSAVIVFVVGFVALCVWHYLGTELPDTILAAGLFLDVIGAAILAIPDIPTIHQLFFSGMVQSAVDHLEPEWTARESVLVEPETSEIFVDSLYIVEDISAEPILESELLKSVRRNPEPSTEGFYELRRAFHEGTNDTLWNHVFGFKAYEDENDERRIYVLHNKYEEPDVKIKSQFDNPFASIKNKLRRSDARFRRMGLSLLISGFILQGISLGM